MTVAELAAGHERVWQAVYRWSAIGKRLWRAGNLRPLAWSANLGYRFYAHNLQRFYTCDWQIDPYIPRPAAMLPTGSKDDNRTVCG